MHMTERLREAAIEIADAGINGWGNLMTETADLIEKLEKQLAVSKEAGRT